MISALGRPFDLGMLYDRRSDTLILGKTLWSQEHLNAARNIIPKPFTNSEVFIENSIEDKTNALHIQADLKLSFLSGLVNVDGAAKYLNDTKSSQRQSRVVLKYETTTELKQLTMEHLGAGKVQYPEVFDSDIATHVVVGILYGAKAFMVFDKEVSKEESLKDVHGNMKGLVKALPGLAVDGHGSVNITEDQKKNTENMRCKMYGDFRTNESPTNFEDAVKVYKQLPSLIGQNGENAVPIEVYLCPLSDIDSKCQRMVREISADLVSKTSATLQSLQSLNQECNDLVQDDICSYFPRLKKQVVAFRENVEHYRTRYQKKLLSVLPQVRGGRAKERELAALIDEKESSPFSRKAMESWLEDKKKEMKRLQGVVKTFDETPLINPEAVENDLYDPSIKYLVCFTFKISAEEDRQISSMDSYLNGKHVLSGNDMPKVDEKSTYRKVRDVLRHLMILKSINKENNEVKFLATDEPLPLNYEGSTGAFLKFYEDGEIENEDLCSYSKPSNLNLEEASESTLKLSWDNSVANKHIVKSYKIQYKDEVSSEMWLSVEVESTGKEKSTVTLTNLQPGTTYHVKVCSMEKIPVSEYSDVLSVSTKPTCDEVRESNVISSSNSFSTIAERKQFETQGILGLCQLLEPPDGGAPAVYGLPLTPVHEDARRRLRKYEVNLSGQRKASRVMNKPNKVVMMVGSTGSGKTTHVNAMVNYILGVKWKDNFRFKMIHEVAANQGSSNIGNQIFSQTQFVTCYTLHHIEGFKVPFTITIVDTPGFGDTRGIKQDEKITEQIRIFFNTTGVGGIDHLDAICFLAQAGIPRLTHTQRYVFDKILAMFGKDIQANIAVLFTFADGQKPQALPSLQEAKVLNKDGVYFKFNNSALFVDNSEQDDDNFDRMFWAMGVKSFEKFFNDISHMEPKSLVLTKEVLKEREQLEVRVSGLQEKINFGINTLCRLRQEKRIFNQHAADINANKNFKYTVTDEIRKQIPLEPGTHTTNCPPCNYTCHYPCKIPRSEEKEGCAAMSNGSCVECPNRCHWSVHVNDQYRVVTELVEVEKEYDNKKTLYEKAKEGQSTVETVINQLQKEFEKTEKVVLTFVAEMQRGLKRLSEIALKKDPLQQIDYLDLLIQSEEMQAKPGFKERIRSLQETRKRAEQINKMAKPGYDPWKAYRENEETRQFLQKKIDESKPWYKKAYNAVKNAVS